MRTRQMLTQKHTEHGRLHGVFPVGTAKADSGISRRGREQKLFTFSCRSYGKYDFIPFGLIYFIYSCADNGTFELLYNRRHHACIKGHIFPPLSFGESLAKNSHTSPFHERFNTNINISIIIPSCRHKRHRHDSLNF
jgi:hypothetical protein